MKVKEVMNEVIAVDRDITIKEAAKIMSERNIGSLVVVRGTTIVGIITEKDIMKNISDISKKISSLMNKRIFTVNQNDDLEDAAAIMAENKVKHLPVIHEEGQLVGIISSADIIKNVDGLEEDFLFE